MCEIWLCIRKLPHLWFCTMHVCANTRNTLHNLYFYVSLIKVLGRPF